MCIIIIALLSVHVSMVIVAREGVDSGRQVATSSSVLNFSETGNETSDQEMDLTKLEKLENNFIPHLTDRKYYPTAVKRLISEANDRLQRGTEDETVLPVVMEEQTTNPDLVGEQIVELPDRDQLYELASAAFSTSFPEQLTAALPEDQLQFSLSKRFQKTESDIQTLQRELQKNQSVQQEVRKNQKVGHNFNKNQTMQQEFRKNQTIDSELLKNQTVQEPVAVVVPVTSTVVQGQIKATSPVSINYTKLQTDSGNFQNIFETETLHGSLLIEVEEMSTGTYENVTILQLNLTDGLPVDGTSQKDIQVIWNDTWGNEWYRYPIGTMFIVLVVVAICGICRRHLCPVHCLLLVFGSTRAVSLFLDKDTLPFLIRIYLFKVGLICLSSAFSILFLVLLRITKVDLLPRRLQCHQLVAIASAGQLLLVLLIDLTARLLFGLRVPPVAGEVLFSVWTIHVSCAYLFVFRQLHIVALRKQSEMIRFTFTKLHIEGAPLPSTLPNSPLGRVTKIMLVAAILGMSLAIVLCMDTLSWSGVLGESFFHIWISWSFQLGARLSEFSVASCLVYVGLQQLEQDDQQLQSAVVQNSNVFSVLCARKLWDCSCSNKRASFAEDIYPAYCATNAAVARTHFTFERWDSGTSNSNVLRKHFSQQLPEQHSRVPNNLNTLLSTQSEGNRRHVSMATLATLSSVHSRPPSLLLNEQGFLSFRESAEQLAGDDADDDNDGSPDSTCRNYSHHFSESWSPARSGTTPVRRSDSHRSPTTKTEELCRRRGTPSKDQRRSNLNLPLPSCTTNPPQDITPDSAVFLEDDIVLCPRELSFSHSMSDLCERLTPRHSARSLLTRIKGSSFSLTSHNGYEPLESKVHSQTMLGRGSRGDSHPWEMRTAFRDCSSRLSRHQDSVYGSEASSVLGGCATVLYVDSEVQTEPSDFPMIAMKQEESEV